MICVEAGMTGCGPKRTSKAAEWLRIRGVQRIYDREDPAAMLSPIGAVERFALDSDNNANAGPPA
jgi:hypothetical protein